MPPKVRKNGSQIPLRLPDEDTETRVSRRTLLKLASWRGTTETEVVHYALKRLASEVLPNYEIDDGPVTDKQIRAIREIVGPLEKREQRSSLLD